jgi:hypothetical protein
MHHSRYFSTTWKLSDFKFRNVDLFVIFDTSISFNTKYEATYVIYLQYKTDNTFIIKLAIIWNSPTAVTSRQKQKKSLFKKILFWST